MDTHATKSSFALFKIKSSHEQKDMSWALSKDKNDQKLATIVHHNDP